VTGEVAKVTVDEYKAAKPERDAKKAQKEERRCERAEEKRAKDERKSERKDAKLEKKYEKTRVRCPRCKGTDFRVIGDTKSSTNGGAAILGGMMFGQRGFIDGALLGTKGRTECLCNRCGKRWYLD
jgi:hypothetical protein